MKTASIAVGFSLLFGAVVLGAHGLMSAMQLTAAGGWNPRAETPQRAADGKPAGVR